MEKSPEAAGRQGRFFADSRFRQNEDHGLDAVAEVAEAQVLVRAVLVVVWVDRWDYHRWDAKFTHKRGDGHRAACSPQPHRGFAKGFHGSGRQPVSDVTVERGLERWVLQFA